MKIKKPKLAVPGTLAAYASLLPIEKTLLQLLAVNVDYCRFEVVNRCLNDMLLTDNRDRQFTSAALRLRQQSVSGYLDPTFFGRAVALRTCTWTRGAGRYNNALRTSCPCVLQTFCNEAALAEYDRLVLPNEFSA